MDGSLSSNRLNLKRAANRGNLASDASTESPGQEAKVVSTTASVEETATGNRSVIHRTANGLTAATVANAWEKANAAEATAAVATEAAATLVKVTLAKVTLAKATVAEVNAATLVKATADEAATATETKAAEADNN